VSSRIGFWSAVPDGAKLRVSVTGTTKKTLVTAHPFVLRGDGVEQTFPDDQIQPGPLEIDLEHPNTYSFFVDLVYTTSGKADVTAEVVSGKKRIPPDGSDDTQFETTVAGSQGQTLGLTFFIVTTK